MSEDFSPELGLTQEELLEAHFPRSSQEGKEENRRPGLRSAGHRREGFGGAQEMTTLTSWAPGRSSPALLIKADRSAPKKDPEIDVQLQKRDLPRLPSPRTGKSKFV